MVYDKDNIIILIVSVLHQKKLTFVVKEESLCLKSINL